MNRLLFSDARQSIEATCGLPLNRARLTPHGYVSLPIALMAFGGTRSPFEPNHRLYLVNGGRRAYLPALMQFAQADVLSPFGQGGINAYAYGAGDPLNWDDPSGHFSISVLKRIYSAAAGTFMFSVAGLLSSAAAGSSRGLVISASITTASTAAIFATKYLINAARTTTRTVVRRLRPARAAVNASSEVIEMLDHAPPYSVALTHSVLPLSPTQGTATLPLVVANAPDARFIPKQSYPMNHPTFADLPPIHGAPPPLYA